MQAPAPRVRLPAAMQVRFFRGRTPQALEEEINAWLAERREREIVEIRQSVWNERGVQGGDELIVSVWYIDDERDVRTTKAP